MKKALLLLVMLSAEFTLVSTAGVQQFLGKWGTPGSGDGQFSIPFSVAVDAFGNVYVADYWNQRVQKFDTSGVFLTKWGTYGSGDGQFYWPVDVAVDTFGNVYVTDSWNDRIQKFSASPSDLLVSLVNEVITLSLNEGIISSLIAPLNTALSALDANNDDVAANTLHAFVNHVEALRGVHLDSANADRLIQLAQQTINLLTSG